MRLGLATRSKPFEDDRGVIRMDGKEMYVIDLDTGDRLENQTSWLWCKGSLLTHQLEGEDGGLLTPEHVEAEADYLVVIVRCDGALDLDRTNEREKK